MARGWYGLYFGDRVRYGDQLATVISLHRMDKNRVTLRYDDGSEQSAVAEWCEKEEKDMPCRMDEPEPSVIQQENQRAARHLVHLANRGYALAPTWVREQAQNRYARDERLVPMLCAALNAMSPAQIEEVVYDAHDPMSRLLAFWWEKHQRADKEREAQEQERAVTARLRQEAAAKLTEAERKAVGLE